MRTKLVPALIASLVGVAALASGCGGSATSDGTTTVKVGLIPSASFFPIYVAQDKGYFADEGIKVDIQVMSNAAAITPSVLNGQLQFGTAATPPFLVASEKGLPIKAVVNSAGTAASEDKDTSAILVRKGGGISSLSDLPGKKVAVNALGALPQVASAAVLREEGVNSDDVDFVPMPFPDMLGAVEQGRVDAALEVEPFLTQALAGGKVEALSPLYTKAYDAGTTDTLVFASKQYISSNADAVAGFKRAVEKANELVAKDPQVLRDALTKYGNVKEGTADKLNLPDYATEFDTAGMQKLADLMVQDGFLGKKIDVSSTIYEAP